MSATLKMDAGTGLAKLAQGHNRVHNTKEEHMKVADPSAATARLQTSVDRAATPASPGSVSSASTYAISTTPSGGRRATRKALLADEDDQPLIDTTAALPLKSKKTERMQKRLGKKTSKKQAAAESQSFLNLPAELVHEVLSYLRPTDLFHLERVSPSTQAFIQQHETTIAKDIARSRYWVLSRCLPLPVPFSEVPRDAHSALLNTKRQEMLNIHKRPYQHIDSIDPLKTCTCMSCVFAWNNLTLLLDFGHWQKNLDARDPIPMIPRGQAPLWNTHLLTHHARLVEKAIHSPLTYIAILDLHLNTTVRTILRRSKYLKHRPILPEHRPYQLSYHEATETDTHIVTDEFLERKGLPSYEFPFHRDNYYNLEAYVPNRKWAKEQERWVYYGRQHASDLEWVKARFGPEEDGEGVATVSYTHLTLPTKRIV